MRIGTFTPVAPVVLAPMAGVTNAPFRTMCRQFAPGLIYVNEMVMATAVVHGNAKTERMMTFGADEQPRSLQIYGSDPVMLGEAIRMLCDADRVDHIDINFGCPAAKVTRKGGGAAVPAKPNLLRAILRSAVAAASPFDVPITIKYRKGLFDSLPTYIQTGRIAVDEGVAAVALHARTAEQHYAGLADWNAIGELKAAVPEIPVLGNGDIWEASDAVSMMAATGCDGVVVGRGCLGRPWLFGDLAAAFRGQSDIAQPSLGTVAATLRRHAELLVDFFDGDEDHACRDIRKHVSWYFKGYPVGGELRAGLATVESLQQMDDLLAQLDWTQEYPGEAAEGPRGRAGTPKRPSLPEHWLDSHELGDAHRTELAEAELDNSGG
jgi:nifR3 family TIM-barrel protein